MTYSLILGSESVCDESGHGRGISLRPAPGMNEEEK
jgi:hypothetical protein